MRYRYILCGIVNPTDKLSDFRLIGANNIRHSTDAIRVELPNEVKLTKYSCDNYSTTDCDIQIKNLNPVVICRMNGRMKQSKELTEQWLNGLQPHEFLKGKYHVLNLGVLSEEQYKWYWKNSKIAYRYDRVPVNEKGELIDKEVGLERFIGDINKFREVLKEHGIKTSDSDELLGFWYHRCSSLSNEESWRKFEDIKNIERFIKPYIEHLEF